MIFPSWVENLVFFDLRFGFLVKNCIYGQILVKYGQNPIKLIKKKFINLNLGLFVLFGFGTPGGGFGAPGGGFFSLSSSSGLPLLLLSLKPPPGAPKPPPGPPKPPKNKTKNKTKIKKQCLCRALVP